AAEQLRALAEALEEAGSLEDAQAELAEVEAQLQAQVPAGWLATKAATQGLDRSLEAQPLTPSASGPPPEQLAQAAEALEGLTPEEQAALAERLDDLADAQVVGNPGAAEALA